MRSRTLVAVVLAISTVSIDPSSAQEHPTLTQSGAQADRAAEARREIMAILDDARSESTNHLDHAIAGFKGILELGTEVPLDLRARALHGLVNAQEKQRRSLKSGLPEFFRAYPPLGPIVVVVSSIVGIALLLLIVRWSIRRGPHPQTLTSFEDFSRDSPEDSDSNRVLTSSVLSQLQGLQPLRMAGLHMDIMPGANEPGFGGLRPSQDTGVIQGFVPDDKVIKIGSVEFSSSVLASIFRWFDRPNKEYLLGWLRSSENNATAAARLVNREKKSKLDPEHAWRVQIVGPHARERAINDLTAQMIVGMGKTVISTDWRSFRSFRDGIRTLNPDNASNQELTRVATARKSFEEALTYDPANWMARFQLALALCLEDEPRLALEHFAVLESVFERALAQERPENPGASTEVDVDLKSFETTPALAKDASCSKGAPAFQNLLIHIYKNPECPFVVLYNKAMALSALPDEEGFRKAIDLLRKLSELEANPDVFPKFKRCKISDRSALELKLYALSSRAHILASRGLAECSHQDGLTKHSDHGKQIQSIVSTIEDLCLSKQEEHWRSLETARAVAYSALARVFAAAGCAWEASENLRKALAAEPMFVEAYLQISEIYIREKDQISARWEQLAESWLKRALEVNAKCQHAQMLLARLYSEPRVGRVEEAIRILQRLPELPEANLLLIRNELDNCTGEGELVTQAGRLFCQIRLRSGSGTKANGELKNLLSKPSLKSLPSVGRFDQLMSSLEPILEEDLSRTEDEERIQKVLQEITPAPEFAAS
jgi:hypothetical protein